MIVFVDFPLLVRTFTESLDRDVPVRVSSCQVGFNYLCFCFLCTSQSNSFILGYAYFWTCFRATVSRLAYLEDAVTHLLILLSLILSSLITHKHAQILLSVSIKRGEGELTRSFPPLYNFSVRASTHPSYCLVYWHNPKMERTYLVPTCDHYIKPQTFTHIYPPS